MIELVEHKVWWLDLEDKGKVREGVLTSRILIVSMGNWFDLEAACEDEVVSFMQDCHTWAWDITEAGTKSQFSINEEYLKEFAVFENPPEQFKYNNLIK